MPEPLESSRRYIRGLDGLRAVAVMAVLAFHLGFGWAPGGLLGVGIFFTLSGYLITDLLLGRIDRQGSVSLQRFWLGRARRLLPALTALLAIVAGWVAIAKPGQLADLTGNIGAAAGYFSNWWLIFSHQSYFARFGPPSPLGHLWSLAIEEQFYLVWPWFLLLLVKALRSRWAMAAVTIGLAAMSATEMGLLWHPGIDPTRLYDGTDTRAFGLLLGAALAFVWPSGANPRFRIRRLARTLDVAGGLALLSVIVMIATVGQYSAFLYQGGLVLLSLATVVAVAAVVHPASRLGVVLGCRPLRWIGVRSYGIYLWHFPIVVLTEPPLGQSESFARQVLQVAATMTVAGLSWRFLEDPIRSKGFRYFWSRARHGPRLPSNPLPSLAAGLVALSALLALTVSLPGGSTAVAPASVLANSSSAGVSDSVTAPRVTLPPPIPASIRPSVAATGPATTTTLPTPSTSCRSVAHIGDSTSESLVSADYLPNPLQRLDAQYKRVGVKNSIMEISGARSIVETYGNQPNGYDVAAKLIASGYHGCWVIALGTNDTANIFVGSNVQEKQRIARMMSVIGDQPVMWVDTVSLVGSGPYSEANMRNWNKGLIAACRLYPNLRVYDWAGDALRGWFISDGIHYSTPGSAHRSELIASALANAFSSTGPSASCTVRG